MRLARIARFLRGFAVASDASAEFAERPVKSVEKPLCVQRRVRVGRASRASVPEIGIDLCPHCARPDESSGDLDHWCGVGHQW